MENENWSSKHRPNNDVASINNHETNHALNTDITTKWTTGSSSSSIEKGQRPRTFLAQYAISEIPSLVEDVSPFPDIIKTGDELFLKKPR